MSPVCVLDSSMANLRCCCNRNGSMHPPSAQARQSQALASLPTCEPLTWQPLVVAGCRRPSWRQWHSLPP